MEELILEVKDIENENLRMRLEDDSLVLLKQFPEQILRTKVLEMLREDQIPKLPIEKKILENRNSKNIEEDIFVKSGITTKRDTLKYLPTNQEFFSSSIIEENIATELPYGTPLLIFHESLDQEWLYVQCSYYRGWILKQSVLLTSVQDRILFEEPEKFIVITKPLLSFQNTVLDLGCKFPVLGVHDEFYEIFVPTKEGISIQTISKNNCHLGYLPYTKENIISLAKSCLGIPYKWGGINYGLDCSLFIMTVFKAFGFQFPRDTKNQEKVIGRKKIDLKGKTEIEKKEILETLTYPSILHKKGHVLLAISSTEVIHAYGDAQKVILSNLENCYGTNLYSFLTTVSCLCK